MKPDIRKVRMMTIREIVKELDSLYIELSKRRAHNVENLLGMLRRCADSTYYRYPPAGSGGPDLPPRVELESFLFAARLELHRLRGAS